MSSNSFQKEGLRRSLSLEELALDNNTVDIATAYVEEREKKQDDMLSPLPLMATNDIWWSGQPTHEDLLRTKKSGVKSVINLRDPSEAGDLGLGVLPNEPELVRSLSLHYESVPTRKGEYDLSEEELSSIRAAMDRSPKPLLLHCRTGRRSRKVLETLGILSIPTQQEALGSFLSNPTLKVL